MTKKVGIYIPGLGETYRKESAEKYARRFMNQMNYNRIDSSVQYSCTVEKIVYDEKNGLSTQQIIIWENKLDEKTAVYRFYEYQYTDVLIADFEKKNVLSKSVTLFGHVIVKLPLIFYRLFYVGKSIGYNPRYRGEALFVFLLFLLMSSAILFLFPVAVALIIHAMNESANLTELLNKLSISPEKLEKYSQVALNITAVILILLPGVNTIITSLATEFSCATGYLNSGERKQKIHGQLDQLLEYICEKEGDDIDVCMHTYSFGSIIALDYIFPFGIPASTRIQKNMKGLITIGCPYDFIQVYFGSFFHGRDSALSKSIYWINVYSLADALASNLRKTNTKGDAEYGIPGSSLLPVNLNYEVTNIKPNVLYQLFTLYSVRTHTCYWDKDDDAQSCLSLVIKQLQKQNIIHA